MCFNFKFFSLQYLVCLNYSYFCIMYPCWQALCSCCLTDSIEGHVLHDSASLWLTLYNIGSWFLNVLCWCYGQKNIAIRRQSFKQIEFWLTSYLVNRTIGQTVKSNTSLSSSVAVYSLVRKAVFALNSCKDPTHFSVRPISTRAIEWNLIIAL